MQVHNGKDYIPIEVKEAMIGTVGSKIMNYGPLFTMNSIVPSQDIS